MEYFKILPVEIKLDILSRVPTETVLECKLVCKPWSDIVRNPSFSKMHLHHLIHPASESCKLGFFASTIANAREWHYFESDSIPKFHYFEYNENHELTTPIERITRINLSPPFENNAGLFFDSCNGLICFSQHYTKPLDKHVCICNPITKECVFLPQIKTDLDTDGVKWASGFGYVSSTNEYKVLELVSSHRYDFGEIHIYTLGSCNGWRNLGKFDTKTVNIISLGVFVGGVLYWMDSKRGTIVAFDLAEEKFCEDLKLPPLPSEESFYADIMVLDGFFSLMIDPAVQGAECFDIWQLKKMNDNYDNEEQVEDPALVWSKEFRVDECTPLAVTKNNGVLTYDRYALSMYDTEASTSKMLVEDFFCQVIPHMNTFVSLKEIGEEDTKIMESVAIQGEKSLEPAVRG